MPEPLYSDLIFPSSSSSSFSQPSISQLLSSLRRANLSIHNRLTSIQHDAIFAASVADVYRRPLVANERCGSWYVRPGRKAGSAYFKSTDGHERAWKFSTRRLNLQLLGMIEDNDGIIIVDSTRRGKRMPDALSTTVPIWCAVLNRALFPASDPRSQELFLPPHLPATTHAQISALLPSFVASLKELNLQLPRCLTKPLRPFWVTQDSQLPAEEDDEGDEDGALADEANTEMNAKKTKTVPPIFEDYHPVICCTASRRIVGGSEMDEGGYIQGAGDDTENWAHGLTPPLFWNHSQELLDTTETDLPSLIATLVEAHEAHLREAGAVPRTKLTKHISVCPLPLEKDASPTPGECRIALTPEVSPRDSWVQSPAYMEVGVGKSKTASRNLRLALPDICQFVSKYLSSNKTYEEPQIIIACQSGKDLSVGAALAANCYLFDNDDNICIEKEDASFTKTMVKIRLGKIMTAFPEANPSRATLQSVNSFLMDWRQ